MELLFLGLLVLLMALALGSGFPVAFALPGAAIVTILIASGAGALFAGDSAAYFAHGGASEWLSAGVTNFRGIYWEVERDTLIAIPLFVFMGIMLQRSKIAEDLLVTMAQLFGPIPGGLGISVVFVGALLAATTGILGATVVAMGLISLPAMQRNKYSMPLATGTIAASGTLGQIIPPSIVLIILADQLASAVDQAGTARTNLYKANTGELSLPSEFAVTSTSAGDMFMGALAPGIVLVALFMLFILVVALIRPKLAPSVAFDGKFDLKLLLNVILILVPPLTLIFVVLGSIITGVATVNQAGAIGAIGATIMAGYRLRSGHWDAFIPAILAILSVVAIAWITSNYNTNVKAINTPEDEFGVMLAVIATGVFVFSVVWSLYRTLIISDTLNSVMLDTAKTTALVFIILLGAAMLTAAFRAFGGEELVRDFLTTLPGGFWTQFLIVMIVIFLLGFFLDFIEIAVVVVPIVAPILLMDPSANITAVWLGVMIGLNMQSSFLTPPFGFALFYLRGVAPASVKTTDIYKGVVPFIALQLLALGIVGTYPPLVNYLPNRASLLSENAPPPVNPLLQHCIETYVIRELDTRQPQMRAAIEQAQALPLDTLPRDIRGDLSDGFEQAGAVFGLIADLRASRVDLDEARGAYKPVHDAVRRLERDIRKAEQEIEATRTRIDNLRFAKSPQPDLRERLEAHIVELEQEREALTAEIPADWPETYRGYAKLLNAETTVQRAYRRASDEAVSTVAELVERLSLNDAMAAIGPEIVAIEGSLESTEPETMDERLQALAGRFRDVEAGSDISGAIRDARRPFRRGPPDFAVVREALAELSAAYEEELAWRQAAAADLLPGLRNYISALSDTIGLRQQDRMPRNVALDVAACRSHHRDISLSF
jgi:tripartite ATP-independent transporter DctM subunit